MIKRNDNVICIESYALRSSTGMTVWSAQSFGLSKPTDPGSTLIYIYASCAHIHTYIHPHTSAFTSDSKV